MHQRAIKNPLPDLINYAISIELIQSQALTKKPLN